MSSAPVNEDVKLIKVIARRSDAHLAQGIAVIKRDAHRFILAPAAVLVLGADADADSAGHGATSSRTLRVALVS